MMMWSKTAIGVVGLLLAGCAGSGDSVETAPSPRWVMTQDQLAATGARTVFEAIEALRPGIVQGTGRYGRNVSPEHVTVYVNGVEEVEGIEVLRRIPVDQVASIRLIGTGEARFRVGGGGGLAVTTVDASRQPPM
jgi:hypothetical protein